MLVQKSNVWVMAQITAITEKEVEVIPDGLKRVVDQFYMVFSEPKRLHLTRFHDHHIPLEGGA